MRYNAQTECFELTKKELDSVGVYAFNALKHVREMAGKPLDGYDVTVLREEDHAQQSILEMAKAVGVFLGDDWAHNIDLRKHV